MDYPDPKFTFSRRELVDAFQTWEDAMEANPEDFSEISDDPAASADYLLRILRGE
jgi:hypothetical protein